MLCYRYTIIILSIHIFFAFKNAILLFNSSIIEEPQHKHEESKTKKDPFIYVAPNAGLWISTTNFHERSRSKYFQTRICHMVEIILGKFLSKRAQDILWYVYWKFVLD